jgi:hypothetical protein
LTEYGWDGYKTSAYGKEMRELMQRLGTECGRELISDTVWIDAALGPYIGQGFETPGPPPKIVVTDMRFSNEFQSVINRGGMTIRIVRLGVGPANSHPSETALDDYFKKGYFDAVIINDGTIADLHRKVRQAVLDFF